MSNFDSKIYKIAKEYVRGKATASPSELNSIFEAENQSEAKKENNFALACLRLICKDTRIFNDPNKNSAEFAQAVKDLKLNILGGSDLGFGKGTSNNLIYRIAIDYYKDLEVRKKKPLRNDFLSMAVSDKQFLKSLVVDRLNEREVYDVITKQAFFKWHYKAFIEDLEYNGVIKKENPGDGTSVSWDKVNPGDGSKFFISQTGAPFNTGTPTVCCVIQEEVESLESIKPEYYSKAFNSALSAFGKKKWEDLSESEKFKVKVNVVDHTKAIFDFDSRKDYVFNVVDVKSKTIKICFGLDYAILCTLPSISLADKNYSDLSKIKKFVGKTLRTKGDKQNIFATQFSATDDEESTEVFLKKVKKLSEILIKKDSLIQKGPSLFFDLNNNEEPYNKIKKDVQAYEKINELGIKQILESEYSPSGLDFGNSMQSLFENLFLKYYTKNRIQFIQFLSDFDPKKGALKQDKATEDIKFYFQYNQGYPKLLAVGAEKRESNEKEPSIDVIKLQNKSNPFEFSELVDNKEQPLYVNEINNNYAVIKKINFTGNAYGELSTGIAGEFLFVTEFLIEEILKSDDASVKSLVDEKNRKFKQNLYDVISYKEMVENLASTNNTLPTILLSTINGFLIFINYIILAEQNGGSLTLSEDSLNTGTSFLLSSKTLKDSNTIVLDNIGKFIENFHLPPLEIKPTVPKKVATTEQKTDAGLVKQKYDNALVSKKQTKEKVYDLNDYNSWLKTGAKKTFVVLAQASNSPCYEDLAKIVSTGTVDQIFEFLLTKFPWDELLAKSLLTNLRKTSNLVGANEFADQVNACLKDGGVDKLLNSFARTADLLQNFDKIINANIPEIPTIPELPYLFVLDFQKVFRDAIFNAVQEIILAVLGKILGVMLQEILGDCQLDGNLDDLLNDKLSAGKTKNAIGALESPVDIATQSNIGELSDTGTNLNSVSVDIIALIRASRENSLENILNGILDAFPNLKIQIKANNSNPLVVLEDYLINLSSSLSAIQIKNLLNGVAGEIEYTKVKIFSKNYNNAGIRTTFVTDKNIALLFNYLDEFINQDLINQEIVTANVIIPDPCYVNFGRLGTEDINLLKELLGNDIANDYIRNSANIFSDQINSICSRLADGIFNFADDLQNLNLISDSSKKALQKSVDTSFTYLSSLQNKTRNDAIIRIKQVDTYIKAAYGTAPIKVPEGYFTTSGLNLNLNYNNGIKSGQYKKLVDFTKESYNLITSLDELKKNELYFSLNINKVGTYKFKDSKIPFYSDIYDKNDKLPFTRYQSNFFFGLYYSDITKFGTDTAIAPEQLVGIFSEQNLILLSQELLTIFEEPDKLKEKYAKQFDDVVAQGGKNTNKFIANMKKMKTIINSATAGEE